MLGSTWEGKRCMEFFLSAMAGGEEGKTIYCVLEKEDLGIGNKFIVLGTNCLFISFDS